MANCNECKRKLGLLEKRHKMGNSVLLCDSCFTDMQKKIKQQRMEYIKKYLGKHNIDFLSTVYENIPYWLKKIEEYDRKKKLLHSNHCDNIDFKGIMGNRTFSIDSDEMDNIKFNQMGFSKNNWPSDGFGIIKQSYSFDIGALKEVNKNNIRDISIEDRTNMIKKAQSCLDFLEDVEKFIEYFKMKNLDFNQNYSTILSEVYSLTELPKDYVLNAKLIETPEEKMGKLEKDLFTKKEKVIPEIDFNNLNGYDFETFLNNLFTRLGYSVIQTPKSGDQGTDLLLSKDGIKTVVQAKRYSGTVSNKAIQEIVASKKYYNAEKAMVITTGNFTKSAFELAQANGVELWDGKKLEKTIRKN